MHSYWAIAEGCSVEEWKPLQADLLAYAGADLALKNPSRMMRLAGAYHIKPGQEPLRCNIIHNSCRRYSYSELRQAIPVPPPPILSQLPSVPQLLELPQALHRAATKYQRFEDIRVPVPELVPLEVCLSKASRELLANGVAQSSGPHSGRNSSGAAIARDLIGTESYLQTIGQRFSGESQLLLSEYAERCTPPLDAKEVEAIWKSAQKDSPRPSIPPEGIETCIRAWYWKECIKPNESAYKRYDANSPLRGVIPTVVEGRNTLRAYNTLRSRITEILERDLSASELTVAFVELSSSTGRPLREIKELAGSIEADSELEDLRGSRGTEIDRLHFLHRRSLTLSKYLPPSLSEPMTKMAQWMGTPPAAFLVALLPTVSSLLDPATEIIVKECIGFIERPIIYAGLVTESGQRKSPILNAITHPLKVLQQEEDARYRSQAFEYSQAVKRWDAKSKEEPPTPPKPPREYYIDKATMEAVDAIKQNQPDRGILWLKDELSGLMASYGEYKGGRGGDKESMLSGWNGCGVKKNLKSGDRVSLLYDAMSVFGAIQDTTLQKKMGDFNDDQGDWARFLWLLIPLSALKLPSSDTTFQLSMLESLYRRLDQIKAAKYRFALDAQRYYDNFHFSLEQRRVAEPRRGMRAAIAKMEGYTARIALILHIIWEVESGKDTPSPYIPRERVESACILAEFFLGQVELIHAEGAAASGRELPPRLAAILEKARQFGELTARKIQSAISWLRSVTALKIRNDFKELALLGYGVCVGKGNRLKFIPNSADLADVSADKSADSFDGLQTLDITQIQDFDNLTADGADIPQTSPSEKSSLLMPENLRNTATPSTELHIADGKSALNSTIPYQQDRYIGSSAPNLDSLSALAADNPSAEISAANYIKNDSALEDVPPPVAAILETDNGDAKGLLGVTDNDGTANHCCKQTAQPALKPETTALILQCQTWVDIVEAVGKNTKQLLLAAKTMTTEQRSKIARLLAADLCSNTGDLSQQLAWIPAPIRDNALQLLTFTIRRIGGVAPGDAHLEYVRGFKFVSVANLGTRNEQWTFISPEGKNIPLFGTDTIEAIALSWSNVKK